MCKYKWKTLLLEYKRVTDVYKEIGINFMLYFEMTFGEKKARTLLKNFDSYIYREMHEWLKFKPTINPPPILETFSAPTMETT